MNGAVIWSCASSRRVLVWCEDGGALAYARGNEAFAGQRFPEVGDLVTLRPGGAVKGLAAGTLRHAYAVRVVERGHFAGLDGALAGTARAADRPQHAGAMPARQHPHLRLVASA